MDLIHWAYYPSVAQNAHARDWLEIQTMLGLAQNTIHAYGRGANDYLDLGLHPSGGNRVKKEGREQWVCPSLDLVRKPIKSRRTNLAKPAYHRRDSQQ